MTVQEAIDKLMLVKDKSKDFCIRTAWIDDFGDYYGNCTVVLEPEFIVENDSEVECIGCIPDSNSIIQSQKCE